MILLQSVGTPRLVNPTPTSPAPLAFLPRCLSVWSEGRESSLFFFALGGENTHTQAKCVCSQIHKSSRNMSGRGENELPARMSVNILCARRFYFIFHIFFMLEPVALVQGGSHIHSTGSRRPGGKNSPPPPQTFLF